MEQHCTAREERYIIPFNPPVDVFCTGLLETQLCRMARVISLTLLCPTVIVMCQQISNHTMCVLAVVALQRKMTMDLRQLGISDIPSLGFGCPSSSLTHDTMLLSKEV